MNESCCLLRRATIVQSCIHVAVQCVRGEMNGDNTDTIRVYPHHHHHTHTQAHIHTHTTRQRPSILDSLILPSYLRAIGLQKGTEPVRSKSTTSNEPTHYGPMIWSRWSLSRLWRLNDWRRNGRTSFSWSMRSKKSAKTLSALSLGSS
jgi:hypothetical protein